jgi:L-threonylcarbamoyladenylate synthase
MPLVAASTAQVDEWCGGLDSASARLARVFWPGPLSLIVDVPPGVVDAVHGGVRSVAVRVPAHVVARALAASFGAPITATSANRSGAVPAAVAGALGALADDPQVLVIDSGPTPGGEPSTIVDARHAPPRLVRAGAVAWDRVLDSIHP